MGGRSYRATQYNRALDASRQVGSLMKPFVYLAALETRSPMGASYNPLSLIDDSPFTHEYEGQSWSPQNYSRTHEGPVPMYYALKNSLNIATARLGLDIGLENIIEVSRRAGIRSEMTPLPSLTLGAFEIKPFEMVESYSTLANMGVHKKVHVIESVESLTGRQIYTSNHEIHHAFSPLTAASIVSMLKEAMRTGTGRLAHLRGFTRPSAGKTGTTSDTKDAWFVGFTPHTLTLTWVGYDDNTSSDLTGASGALPLWIEYMRAATAHEPFEDFKWPHGVEPRRISQREIQRLIPQARDFELVETELIF